MLRGCLTDARAGSGTLVGADLTNLSQARRLGAPVPSIGGAGTSDAIFLADIAALNPEVLDRG